MMRVGTRRSVVIHSLPRNVPILNTDELSSVLCDRFYTGSGAIHGPTDSSYHHLHLVVGVRDCRERGGEQRLNPHWKVLLLPPHTIVNYLSAKPWNHGGLAIVTLRNPAEQWHVVFGLRWFNGHVHLVSSSSRASNVRDALLASRTRRRSMVVTGNNN